MNITDRQGPSKIPSHEQAVEIWLRLLRGEYQHSIAAIFGFNPARVHEVKSRKRHPSAFDDAMKKFTKH